LYGGSGDDDTDDGVRGGVIEQKCGQTLARVRVSQT